MTSYDGARAAWLRLESARVPAADALRADERVAAFAEQFAVDVARIDDEQRAAFYAATGEHAFAVVQAVWVEDMGRRLRPALATVAGLDWSEDAPHEVADRWPLVDEFMRSVARLDALDPVLTELVRLRGARQHACRVCLSRRSVAAVEAAAEAGADLDAVDDYEASDLHEQTKQALRIVDAMVWTPSQVPGTTMAEEQAVEVVLDVVRNAANKIAVALAADAPEVTDGVQLFTTDADGVLSTV